MNESKKLLITIGVVSLAVIGMLVGVYLQMKTIGYRPFKGPESLLTKIQKQKQLEKKAQEEIEQIEGKKKELRRLQHIERKVTQLLPTEARPELLLFYIQKKADEAGVKPQMIKPGKSTRQTATRRPGMRATGVGGGSAGEPKYEEWIYEIQVKGNYDQIGRFINLMEEFQVTGPGGRQEVRFFGVKELTITALENGLAEGGVHVCKLTMQTFRYTGQDVEDASAGARRP